MVLYRLLQACKEQLDPVGESAGLVGLARSYLQIGRTSEAMDQVLPLALFIYIMYR